MNRDNFVDHDPAYVELTPKPDESLTALERFVTHNDELLRLEERIGRFNIFDALRATRDELKHSNFLAWLLDPAESHGQGALFLKAVLMDLLPRARELGFDLPVSPIQIDAAELHGLEVRREWRNIDLLIKCDDPSFVIAIENKIDSGEHSEQLSRYKRTIAQEFPGRSALYVFLTREGDEPSDEEWCPTSYRDLHRILSRVAQSHGQSIGDDVRTFLEHYLRLIGSRFMDDPQIDDLCQTIYKNHRAAIDLIVERVWAGNQGWGEAIKWLEQSPDWFIAAGSKTLLYVAPAAWTPDVMPTRTNRKGAKVPWVVMELFWDRTYGAAALSWGVGPHTDQVLREHIINGLRDRAATFGEKRGGRKGKIPEGFSRIFKQRHVLNWRNSELPDTEQIMESLRRHLDRCSSIVQEMPSHVIELLRDRQPAK